MIAAGAAVLLGWSLNVTDANAQTRYEQQRQNSYQSFKKGPSANNPNPNYFSGQPGQIGQPKAGGSAPNTNFGLGGPYLGAKHIGNVP